MNLAFVENIAHGIYKLYFTRDDIWDLYGDDWDDVPYEYNASPPHTHRKQPNKEIIFRTYILESDVIQTPCYGYTNSPYSMLDIRGWKVPWLRIMRYYPTQETLKELYMGVSLREVKYNLIKHDPNHNLYKNIRG